MIRDAGKIIYETRLVISNVKSFFFYTKKAPLGRGRRLQTAVF